MLGAVVGVAAGAVLGLLFAPGKGSELRKRLTRKGSNYAEDAQENLNEYIDTTAEVYDTVKDGAAGLVDKAKKNVASAAEALRAK